MLQMANVEEIVVIVSFILTKKDPTKLIYDQNIHNELFQSIYLFLENNKLTRRSCFVYKKPSR